MKSNWSHKIVAALMLIFVMLPMALQLSHALEKDHKHSYCTAKDVKHIHEKKSECDIFHTQINHNSLTLLSDFSLNSIPYCNSTIACTPQEFSSADCLLKSPRAPPYFNA